ncbi:MAG: hypothetical protein ACK5BN_13295, partial [Planctomycetota bacterium]
APRNWARSSGGRQARRTHTIKLETMESLGGQFGGRFGGRQGQQGQNPPPAEPTRKRTVEVVAGQTVDVEL